MEIDTVMQEFDESYGALWGKLYHQESGGIAGSLGKSIETFFAEKLQAYGEAKYREGYSKGVVEEGLDCYKHAKDAYNRGKKGLPFADPYTE